MKNIYVGNLNFHTDDEALRSAFSQLGTVANVTLVRDRESGQPRGFAFVEMSNDAEADAAIAQLNGTMLDGRQITVNEARPRPERGGFGGRPGGGGGRFSGGRGGSGGGGGRGRDRDRGPRW